MLRDVAGRQHVATRVADVAKPDVLPSVSWHITAGATRGQGLSVLPWTADSVPLNPRVRGSSPWRRTGRVTGRTARSWLRVIRCRCVRSGHGTRWFPMTGTTAADGDRHVGSPSCTLATGTPAAGSGTSATSPTGGRRGATPAGGVPSCAQDLRPSRRDAVRGSLWVAGSVGPEARLDIQHHQPEAGAASRVAPWWAALVAVGGFTHGIGELRQGSAGPRWDRLRFLGERGDRHQPR